MSPATETTGQELQMTYPVTPVYYYPPMVYPGLVETPPASPQDSAEQPNIPASSDGSDSSTQPPVYYYPTANAYYPPMPPYNPPPTNYSSYPHHHRHQSFPSDTFSPSFPTSGDLIGDLPKDNTTRSRSTSTSKVQSGGKKYLSSNIYIRGLSPETTDSSLEEICSRFGTIISSKAIIDVTTGECKGYGFVMFAEDSQAQVALSGLSKKGYHVSFARVGPRTVTDSMANRLEALQDVNSTNVYLSNLPYQMTHEELFAMLSNYKIESCKILYENGHSRGVGFVKVDTRESAEALIQEFNGYVIPATSHRLQVRFADSAAQKKVKTQVTKKRNFRPYTDYQNLPRQFMDQQLQYGMYYTSAIPFEVLPQTFPTPPSSLMEQPPSKPVVSSGNVVDPEVEQLSNALENITC